MWPPKPVLFLPKPFSKLPALLNLAEQLWFSEQRKLSAVCGSSGSFSLRHRFLLSWTACASAFNFLYGYFSRDSQFQHLNWNRVLPTS